MPGACVVALLHLGFGSSGLLLLLLMLTLPHPTCIQDGPGPCPAVLNPSHLLAAAADAVLPAARPLQAGRQGGGSPGGPAVRRGRQPGQDNAPPHGPRGVGWVEAGVGWWAVHASLHRSALLYVHCISIWMPPLESTRSLPSPPLLLLLLLLLSPWGLPQTCCRC